MSIHAINTSDAAVSARLYRAVWRWHFYAGIIVAPFLAILALTGVIMLYGNSVETFLGAKHYVAAGGERASIEDQATVAVASVPDGKLKLAVRPASPERASVFIINANGQDIVVSVDPHGPKVLDTVVKDKTWFYFASNIHGTLLLGDVGDRIQETVAGLGIVLLLSGMYMWWPRNGRGFARSFVPNLAQRGRALWKGLHASLGLYIGVVLLFFLLSGLAWTGVWGTKIVQAWSTFPAEKWDNVPLSDDTHAAMNHGAVKEVPWALEQTAMPASGSHAGHHSHSAAAPVDLDSVSALARQLGFSEQFRVNVPQSEEGVYTISADSMDGDTTSATGDRTVHVDRFTGNVLAEVSFADYSLAGKAMAVGIALHQGNLGPFNTALNLAFCLSVLFMCASGFVMWWKRRPSKRFGAPLYPKGYRSPKAVLLIGLAVCIAFPLTGIAVALFALVDFLLPKRLKEVSGRAIEV